jgi:hypothetical protein
MVSAIFATATECFVERWGLDSVLYVDYNLGPDADL